MINPVFYSFISTLMDELYIVDINVFLINLISAVLFIIAGIFLGKFVKFLAKKIIERSGVERTAKKNFIELFLNVLKWSIYLLFISLALDQLGIPQLTKWLTSILVVIPALVGALLLIVIGFGIAIYLKSLIEESDIQNKNILAGILFYFVIYAFLVFAFKTALISLDKNTINIILIILTGVASTALAVWHVKKKR